jgi:ATP-dependent DNA helicase RecQ
MLDDEQQEEIHDYFMESESDNIENALREFDEIMILMNCD